MKSMPPRCELELRAQVPVANSGRAIRSGSHHRRRWGSGVPEEALPRREEENRWPSPRHGSPTSCHILGLSAPSFIQSPDCPSLNDNYPAIIFADACSNPDTDIGNIGRAMLQQGAVGFVGATKVAYGVGAWNEPSDGSSQSLGFYFTTAVTSGNYTQGAALQLALRQMYT